MSLKAEKADQRFQDGFSCSQAVFSVFGQDFGLDSDLALKLSQSFGGGMAHLGLTCGAVTGAFLAIGLKHGRIKPEDLESRDKTYALMKDFVVQFKEKFGSINCRELVGYDMDDPEQFEKAKDEGVFEDLCPRLVRSAAQVVEELLTD